LLFIIKQNKNEPLCFYYDFTFSVATLVSPIQLLFVHLGAKVFRTHGNSSRNPLYKKNAFLEQTRFLPGSQT